jgi:hypothetical protein
MGVKPILRPLCVCARARVCVHVFPTIESVCVGDPACMSVCVCVCVSVHARTYVCWGDTNLTLHLNCVILFKLSPHRLHNNALLFHIVILQI